MPVQTSNELEFDFGAAPPAESRPSRIGDHFPPGIRLKFEVASLVQETYDDNRRRVQLSARCISGPCVGQSLSDSFGFPLPSEMGQENKLYGAKLFHAFMMACGAKQIGGAAKIPLPMFVGKTFECVCKDKDIAESEERDPNDPSKPRWPARKSSQIDKLFRPDAPVPVSETAAPATQPVPAAPVAAPAPTPVQEPVAAAPVAAAPASVAAAVDALFETP